MGNLSPWELLITLPFLLLRLLPFIAVPWAIWFFWKSRTGQQIKERLAERDDAELTIAELNDEIHRLREENALLQERAEMGEHLLAQRKLEER